MIMIKNGFELKLKNVIRKKKCEEYGSITGEKDLNLLM